MSAKRSSTYFFFPGFQNLQFFFHFFYSFSVVILKILQFFLQFFFLSLFSVENFKSKSERFYRKSVEKKSMIQYSLRLTKLYFWRKISIGMKQNGIFCLRFRGRREGNNCHLVKRGQYYFDFWSENLFSENIITEIHYARKELKVLKTSR